MVSIHAPAWGATRLESRSSIYIVRFNSRSRVGSDPRRRPDPSARRGFNSRSRVGSDANAANVVKAMLFQFTLPRGERLRTALPLAEPEGFNSRSRVGSDRRPRRARRTRAGFNSRSRVGSDHSARSRGCRSGSFNSRSRVGSD